MKRVYYIINGDVVKGYKPIDVFKNRSLKKNSIYQRSSHDIRLAINMFEWQGEVFRRLLLDDKKYKITIEVTEVK